MKKNAIIGTPVTPVDHLDELAGSSFCVSFFARASHLGDVGDGRQLDRILEQQDPDGMLLVDNGAYSAYTNKVDVDWLAFEVWAGAIARAHPAAIVVLPDIIDGIEAQNDELIRETWAGLSLEQDVEMERLMVVWHLHESLERLQRLVEEGWQWIALGSSGEYWDPKTKAWADRIELAFAAIDEITQPGMGNRRPHIHMMRAQLQHQQHDFDSSDSTNVARNHSRYKGEAGHVGRFADRLQDKLTSTCDDVQRIETPAETNEIVLEINDLLTGARLWKTTDINVNLFDSLIATNTSPRSKTSAAAGSRTLARSRST